MDCALFLLITSIIAGGVLGALLRGWGLVVRLLRLEEGQQLQSGRLTSLEKSKAAQVKWAKKDQTDIELNQVAMNMKAPTTPKDPWEY